MLRTSIRNAMWQVDIEIPRFTHPKTNLDTGEKELNFRIGLNRDMKTKLTIFETQAVVGMFLNNGARSQAKQPNGLQRTLKPAHNMREVRTRIEQIGVRPILDSRRGEERLNRMCDVGGAPERYATPVSFVVRFVEMQYPSIGWNSGEIGTERVRIKIEGKPQRFNHALAQSVLTL